MVDFKKAMKRAPRLDLNPSSADRWTTCTASPQFILDNWDKLPPSDTAWSQEGTTAHEVAASFLQNRKPDTKDSYKCPVPVDKEMLRHGWNYMEYVEGLLKPGGKLFVEQKLSLFYAESRNAIVDAAVANPSSLHIIDYKYGEGVIVNPEENLQAIIYAKTVAWNFVKLVGSTFEYPDDFPVFITIYQPRGRDATDEPFRTWGTTWGHIRKSARKIFDVATNILWVLDPVNPKKENDLVFRPSPKACQWCPAKGFCPERQKELTKDIELLAVIDDQKKHFPPVQAISVKQLCAILTHRDQIKKWLDDAASYALTHMKNGGSLPGFKLVTSRGGNRYWTNPVRAKKILLESTILRKEDVVIEDIITPAAAEKLLGKHKFNTDLTNLIAKNPGVPVIAPEDDKRESCQIDATNEFTNLEEF